jgi:uncharacterized membrane protein YcjF (UPF0283 family)
MNWLAKTYKTIANHIGKILSGAGAALLSIDVAGYGDQIRGYATQYGLGENAVKKIGIAIFVLLMARTWYAGWKMQQTKDALQAAQSALPQPTIIPAQSATQLPQPNIVIPMPPVAPPRLST